MKGSASSSWPTATANSFAQTIDNPTPGITGGTTLAGAAEDLWPTAKALTGGANSKRAERGAGGPDLQEAAESMWKTPSAQEPGVEHRPLINADGTRWTGGERAYDAETGRLVQTGLPQMVKANEKTWGTPRASDAEKGGPNQAFGAGGTPLPAQAANWPTPAARDHKGENSADHLTNGTGRLHMDQLPNAVAHGFSHPDQVTEQRGLPSSQWRPTSRRLLRSVTSHVALTSLRRWLRRGNWKKRRLNPLFVEWLMGWPKGHALCVCSETEWSRYAQDMRGALSAMPMVYGPWIWEPPAEAAPAPVQMDMFGEPAE